MSDFGSSWFSRKRATASRSKELQPKARKSRRSGIMALEPRMMYDGAAAATVGAAAHHHHHDGAPDHAHMLAAEKPLDQLPNVQTPAPPSSGNVAAPNVSGSNTSDTNTHRHADRAANEPMPHVTTLIENPSIEGATVTTFTVPNPGAPLGDFTATITFGDNTPPVGLAAVNNGIHSFAGTLISADERTNVATAAIKDAGATAVAIADAPLSASGVPTINGVEGAALTMTVATFTEANPDRTAGDFQATIAWGDGTTSVGTVNVNNGVYSVVGTHTYAAQGAYTATAAINDVGGKTAVASSTAAIADAPLIASGVPAIGGVEGAAISATIATFTDGNPVAPLSDFTATVNWGDGTTSAGTVSVNNGVYSVDGTHTYAKQGAYTATATVNDVGGSTATASSTAAIADAPIFASGVPAISGVEGAATSATIATFTDGNPVAPLSDFTATVNWGDGTTSAGTVSVNDGVYSVGGTHTYAQQGAYTATAIINDVGGSTATASSTATIAGAVLNASSAPTEIMFIDSQVPDADILAHGAKPGVEVVMLDANSDGVQQIANFLQRHPDPNLVTIDIVAHGADGILQLGNTLLASSTIDYHQTQLAAIGNAMQPGGTIQIFGCDVAPGRRRPDVPGAAVAGHRRQEHRRLRRT